MDRKYIGIIIVIFIGGKEYIDGNIEIGVYSWNIFNSRDILFS